MRRWHFNTSWIISSLWNWPNLHSSISDTPFFTFSQKVGCFPHNFSDLWGETLGAAIGTSLLRGAAHQPAAAAAVSPWRVAQRRTEAGLPQHPAEEEEEQEMHFFFLGGWVYHPYNYRLPLFWGGWLAVCKSRFFVKRMTNDGCFLWKWKEIIMKIQLHIVRLDLENVVWISVRSAKRWLDRSRSNSHTATGQYIRATGCSSTVRRLFLPRGRE